MFLNAVAEKPLSPGNSLRSCSLMVSNAPVQHPSHSVVRDTAIFAGHTFLLSQLFGLRVLFPYFHPISVVFGLRLFRPFQILLCFLGGILSLFHALVRLACVIVPGVLLRLLPIAFRLKDARIGQLLVLSRLNGILQTSLQLHQRHRPIAIVALPPSIHA